jgi:short-subunit dehydrogenase
MKIDNKVFLVTGAGGGIGGALATGLLAKGAYVAAVDLNQEQLDKLSSQSERLSKFAVNITDRESILALPDKVLTKFGNIDAIINCAGIIQPFVIFNDLSFESIEKVMNVNFYGTINVTKAFLPHLLNRPEAYLVNVSSMGGFLPVPGQGVYGASKAAVKLFTESLYAELMNTNVHVSVVFPGATATKITENSGVSVPKLSNTANDSQKFPMLTAEQSANIIIKGIESNKPLIFTGKDSKFMNKLYRINPVYATRFIANKMKSLLG